MPSKDFFSQPSQPPPPNSEAYRQVCEALEDWESRSYVQDAPWTETNETRRAKRVETLESLKEWWEAKGYYSPKQLELIERVATTE